MGQIKNKNLYPIKDAIANGDYFIGSNSEADGETVNFSFQEFLDFVIDNSTGNIVVNNPDEEDLTTVSALLKFKDRLASGNQIGYRIIRADFDWENIPAAYSDSIWELRYEYDLNNGTITLPDNVFIYFNGGYVSNYTSITGNNTIISTCKPNGFDGSGTLDASFVFDVCFSQDDKDKLDGIEALATVSDLGYTASPSNGTITNTGGSNAVIPSSDNTNAGLLPPIQTITEKLSSVGDDLLYIADSEDSDNPKGLKLSNLPTVTGSTNLAYVTGASNGTVTSDTGTDAVIPLASSAPNTAGLFSGSEKDKLLNIEANAQVNVQSDWNQANPAADSFIHNKPTSTDVLVQGTVFLGDAANPAGVAPGINNDPIPISGDFTSAIQIYNSGGRSNIAISFNNIGTTDYQPIITIKSNTATSFNPPASDLEVVVIGANFSSTGFNLYTSGSGSDVNILISLIRI